MLLSCPNCRSGLEVPEGTTALVRCPVCKSVFSPTAAPDPGEEEGARPEEERPKASPTSRRLPRVEATNAEDQPKASPTSRRLPRVEVADAEEKPRASPTSRRLPRGGVAAGEKPNKKKDGGSGEVEKSKEQNRDFDPISEEEDSKRKRKKRRGLADSKLSPEQRIRRRKAFERAASGATLIWLSFAIFMFTMALILIFFFQSAFTEPMPLLITGAGILGLIGWLMAAIGVGLCLSGPSTPGHWTFGISAAVAVAVHLVLLLALASQGKEVGIMKADDTSGAARWAAIPTRLNATMFYITVLLYPDSQDFTPRGGRMLLSAIVGVLEMTRTVLILAFLSCLARAALDEELAHKCTRAAGIASGGPGLLALLILVFVAAMTETGTGMTTVTRILFSTVQMGGYAIVIGLMWPALMVAREVNDACDEPYQSLIPKM